MKSKIITLTLILLEIPYASIAASNRESYQASYVIGAVIALFILGYLIYTLLKPDKF